MNEDLRKWFSQKWVRMDTKGNIKGDCAREDGEGKPKCLPLAKAQSMDKEDRAAAARRKRREDPVADRSGKGGKPINVATEEVSTSELIKKSHSKRGSPGTLKAKINGPITLEKVRALKNRNNATTLDKKQANFYINMHSEEYLEEKNVPTNPGLWARAKSLARSKFDVYPSAYANGWAAKWYKGKGGGWKSVQEGKQMKSLKDILSEGIAVSSDFKLVNSVNAQGKPVTRKVRAHRKTISPEKMESVEKSDVLTSIQKFVGRQYDEEVEQVDEIDMSKTLAAYNKGKPEHAQAKIDTRTSAERKAETEKMLSARAAAKPKFKPQPIKPSTPEQQMKNQNDAMAKSYANNKRGQYVGDSVELSGNPIIEVRSAAARLQLALQKARKQREEEEARKAANEKRALEPKKQGVAEGQINELSKGTLSNYSNKADMDIVKKHRVRGPQAQAGDKAAVTKTDKHINKRMKGIDSANSRLNKGVSEAKDPREYDYEGDMAKTQLRSIIANSQAVHDMLKDTTNLAEWVQSKITKAEDYISTVADYMTAEMSEGYVAEAKKEEDDDEDYSKNHKLDPDSGVEADQHIHVQLKKAIDSTMKPYEVSFKNGKKHSVSSPVAKTIVTAVEKLKPEHRKAVHDELHKSYDSLMAVHKAITGK
jgi:hypothetical protein